MEMKPITSENFEDFHALLTDYYREGEDADTPQGELDGFIRMLFDLIQKNVISGSIAYESNPVGFVLWWMDTREFPFSNKPGYGTILEIGVIPGMRGSGLGRELVQYAENAMDTDQSYVCAYGPAEQFWEACGYRHGGEIATNRLKLFEKISR